MVMIILVIVNSINNSDSHFDTSDFLITLLITLSDHLTKMLKAHSIAISSSEPNSDSFTYQVSQRRTMAYIEKRVSVQGHPFAVPHIRA